MRLPNYWQGNLKTLQKLKTYSVGNCNTARTANFSPVGGRHAHVLKDDLARGLAVPAHLVLLRAEAQAGHALLHHDACDGLARAAHHQV